MNNEEFLEFLSKLMPKINADHTDAIKNSINGITQQDGMVGERIGEELRTLIRSIARVEKYVSGL